ncbi:MAG: hypothetical protein KatS3mg068_2119 [Candidatus Sericytochromatia bacterium]|nr:MAG: hypothetical protein KatS3mg068_2119 [Candidatus Sericytochromatia bacterium]
MKKEWKKPDLIIIDINKDTNFGTGAPDVDIFGVS